MPAPASLPTPAPDTGLVTVQGISFKPAPEWTAVPPAMQMRAAEYDIPGDEGDASLAIFRFPGGAGTINANLERWCGQFAQPDGSNSMEHAQIEQTEVNGHAVHTIWLTGTYVAAMTPGAPVSNNNPGWALLGAIVETPDSHYYFKAIGPEATLEANREAFDQMVASFQTP